MIPKEAKDINPEEFKEWMELLFSLGGWGGLIALIAYIAFCPEKAEKVSSLIWKLFAKLSKVADKKYIAHDIQGRVNDFTVNYLKKEIKDYEPTKIKIVWIEEGQSKEAFLKSDSIIVRMRKSKDQNKNFVNAAMVYIANTILIKAKRYITPRQKEGIDLFVARKLFEKEKREVVAAFIDEYLYKRTGDVKIREIFEKFDLIDKAALFFPVFIQEMTFLGEKVFLSGRDPRIQEEVTKLINFLNDYANRKTGEDNVNTLFQGDFCKFRMMIIGKIKKVFSEGTVPYINFIRKSSLEGIETIYILGDSNRKSLISEICSNKLLEEICFSKYNQKIYTAEILGQDGEKVKVDRFLLVLRKNQVENYIRQN